LRRERELEGIANAKAADVYKGRGVSKDAATVRGMKSQGLGPAAIAGRHQSGVEEMNMAHEASYEYPKAPGDGLL
jgi:hypothetical protein